LFIYVFHLFTMSI